jgi:hypothetical protein
MEAGKAINKSMLKGWKKAGEIFSNALLTLMAYNVNNKFPY